MNYWIINKTQTKPSYSQENKSLSKSSSFSVKIETLRDKLSVRHGDGFVFFDMNEAKFQSYGKIDAVAKNGQIPHRHSEKDLKPKNSFTVSGEITNKLTKTNSITDLSYSLLRINSYIKPQNHFKHQLTTVNKNDYETIVKGLIYISRTAFGKIVNSLPHPYKLEFKLLAIQEFKKDELINVEYIKLLDFLHKYLDNKILSKGRILIETDKLIKKKLSDIIPVSDIGFYGKNKEGKIVYDSIDEQARIFRELFDIDANNEIINEIKKAIKENKEIENRFNKLFKRKPLPLYL